MPAASRPGRRAALGILGLLLAGGGSLWWIFLRDAAPPAPALPELAKVEADVRTAIEAAHGRLAADLPSAAAWGDYAMVLDAHEFLPEAAEAYAQAGGIDPEDPRWPALEAWCLPEGDPARVRALLERASTAAPRSPALHLRLGLLLITLGETPAAEGHLTRAIELDPGSSHALWGLARLRLLRGDRAGALGRLEEAARIRPGHREVHALLASVYAALGRVDRASLAEVRAAALTGTTPIPDPWRSEVLARGVGANHLAGRARQALARQDPEAAVTLFDQALARRPGDVVLRTEGARARFMAGRVDQAAGILDAVLDEDPQHLPARRMRALAAVERNEPGVAAAHALAALAAVPGDEAMQVLLSRIRLGEGRVGEALGRLRRVLERQPQHEEAASLLIWTLQESGEAGAGEEAFRVASRLLDDYLPPSPRARLAEGVSLAGLGRFPEAVRALEAGRAGAGSVGNTGFLAETQPILESWRNGAAWRRNR